jgi:hypothetical protein
MGAHCARQGDEANPTLRRRRIEIARYRKVTVAMARLTLS